MVSLAPNSLRTYRLRNIHPNDMCRICMLPSVYIKNSGHELTPRICRMLHISTQIDVSIHDGYPQVVCSNCYKQLYDTYKFVVLAKNTSRKLRRFDQTVIKPEEEIPEQQISHPVLSFESKSNLLLFKENIDTNSNITVVKRSQEKFSTTTKTKSNDNKENTVFKKRFILRSDLKKDDVIIIENITSSIDLTQTSPVTTENYSFGTVIQNKTTRKELTPPKVFDKKIPEPISVKIKKRAGNESKQNIISLVDNIDEPIILHKVLTPHRINEKTRKRSSNEKKIISPIENIVKKIVIQNKTPKTINEKIQKRTSDNKKNLSSLIENLDKKIVLQSILPQKVLSPIPVNQRPKRGSMEETKKPIKNLVLVENPANKRSQNHKKSSKNIKINIKYLTRTVKKELEDSPIPPKSPKQKKETEIKKEPITPTVDDFLSAVGLVRKITTDAQIKYECDICDQKFLFIEPYKRHLSVQHKLSPYECRICGQKLASRFKLKTHKDVVHGGKNPYRCTDCNSTFKEFDNFLIHMRKAHVKKLPYHCKICKTNFMTKEKLQEHSFKHSNEPPKPVNKKKNNFHCEYCEKKFKKNSDLLRHLRVHTGERPFACKICNQRFQQAHNLTKHMIIHTQEKAFVCHICNKSFGRNDSMLRHMLTHSIEKPFVCTKCKKMFARQSQLDKHCKSNHLEDAHSLLKLKKEL